MAFLRTFEAALAIIIISTSIFYILNTETKVKKPNIDYEIYNNRELKDCIIDKNISCINNTIKEYSNNFCYNFSLVNNTSDLSILNLNKDISTYSISYYKNSSIRRLLIIFLWSC